MKKKQEKKSWFKRVIGAKKMFAHLPFMYFVGFLAILYIANGHYAEKNVREVQKLKSEIREYRWEYVSLKSNLMYNSTQTQIARKVKSINLGLDDEIPQRIIVGDQ